MSILTLFLVTASASLAGGLLAPAVKSGCARLRAATSKLRKEGKEHVRAWRSRREMMRSVADWIESIRCQFWFREFATREIPKTLEANDRMLSHAHGIPFWKLHVCEQMGWTVGQFDRLPDSERLAWEHYFRRDDASRRASIERSWKRRDRQEVARFLEYREQTTASRVAASPVDVAH